MANRSKSDRQKLWQGMRPTEQMNFYKHYHQLLPTRSVGKFDDEYFDVSFVQVDCSDAVQKVLKGEKPAEKERRKRLVLFMM